MGGSVSEGVKHHNRGVIDKSLPLLFSLESQDREIRVPIADKHPGPAFRYDNVPMRRVIDRKKAFPSVSVGQELFDFGGLVIACRRQSVEPGLIRIFQRVRNREEHCKALMTVSP